MIIFLTLIFGYVLAAESTSDYYQYDATDPYQESFELFLDQEDDPYEDYLKDNELSEESIDEYKEEYPEDFDGDFKPSFEI